MSTCLFTSLSFSPLQSLSQPQSPVAYWPDYGLHFIQLQKKSRLCKPFGVPSTHFSPFPDMSFLSFQSINSHFGQPGLSVLSLQRYGYTTRTVLNEIQPNQPLKAPLSSVSASPATPSRHQLASITVRGLTQTWSSGNLLSRRHPGLMQLTITILVATQFCTSRVLFCMRAVTLT
jgi:hypothetical protein